MNLNDDHLVNLLARCALKDQTALKALYDSTAGYLNSVAFRILNSEENSNEALQEGFIQIWQNAGTYRPHQSKPLTWMTSIIRYRAIDRLSADQRRRQHVIEDDDEGTLVESATSESCPLKDVENDALALRIRLCLNALSANIRQSVELAYLQGFSREEIASSLDANVNTVKSWLKRGCERLKSCLAGEEVTHNG